MRKNGLKKWIVTALLLTVIIGQSGLTFSAVPPKNTSFIDITRSNMVFNLIGSGSGTFFEAGEFPAL